MTVRDHPVQVKHAHRCEWCGFRFVNIRGHYKHCKKRPADGAYDPLSPQERKAVDMLAAGATRAEIADEMVITNDHLSQLFTGARRKDVHVAYATTGGGTRYPAAVPIEKLAALRATLKAHGLKRNEFWDVMTERTGMSRTCLRVRLWRYDTGNGPKRKLGEMRA